MVIIGAEWRFDCPAACPSDQVNRSICHSNKSFELGKKEVLENWATQSISTEVGSITVLINYVDSQVTVGGGWQWFFALVSMLMVMCCRFSASLDIRSGRSSRSILLLFYSDVVNVNTTIFIEAPVFRIVHDFGVYSFNGKSSFIVNKLISYWTRWT